MFYSYLYFITKQLILLWLLLPSHSLLLLRMMIPPMRPPRLRFELFPLIYLPHLLVLPATFWTSSLLADLPIFLAFYVIPVRWTKGLFTASFRFHLTMDTRHPYLSAVCFVAAYAHSGLSPVRTRPCRANQ